ncbi:Trimeric GatFAB AmidoTransferase(AdT) complex subunit [Umbelopsis nana]
MGNQPSAIQFQPAIDARNDKLAEASHSRYLAQEEAKFIRESEQEAESARASGHISAAEDLDRQADIHRVRMHEHNQHAAQTIFLANNPSRESHVLLLHGLSTNEAIPLVRNHLARLYNIDSIKHIVILTGLEKLTQDIIDSFWPAAERAMQEFDVDIQCNKPSDGVIYIRFGDDNSESLLADDFLQTDIPLNKLRNVHQEDATDVLKECLGNIRDKGKAINAFISVEDKDFLEQQASEAQTRWLRGHTKSVLDGVPIAVKDNICTERMKTTCGSKMLEDFHSPYDATVVKLLREAGALIIAKANMDQFGMGSANVHSHFGHVNNPTNTDGHFHFSLESLPSHKRSAGGSSGGSAAAVAADLCFAALGSDTGGSVRLPASYCGVVGFKPSYGRISRRGLVAYANSLDTIGILTKDVHDAELIYGILSKYDKQDPTSMLPDLRERIEQEFEDYYDSFDPNGLKGIRIGVPQEYRVKELDESIVRIWEIGIQKLRDLGATIVPVSLPHTQYALPAYYILALAEASSNLARFDGMRYGYSSDSPKSDLLHADTRTEGFGAEVKRRIMMGTFVLSSGLYEEHFLPAQKLRRLVQQDFNKVFCMPNPLLDDAVADLANTSKVHAILTPSAISTAPTISNCIPEADDPTQHTKVKAVDAFVNDVMTVPASLAGIPAITVPAGISSVDGWPVGLQLLAQYGDEPTLLHVARQLETVP